MQVTPIDRASSWSPNGADLPSAGADAATPPRASSTETQALQEKAPTPVEPSVKIEISSAFDEIVKQEKAAQLALTARPGVDYTIAAANGRPSPDTSTDPSNATGAIGAVNSTKSTQQPDTATEAARLADTGKLPGPEQPSSATDQPNKDWTTKVKAEEEKPPEPPKEPISKKLLEFLQSLWRAAGQAIDVVDGETNKTLNPNKLSEGPLTYNDPSAKKVNDVSSSSST
jgi:hypothetical protein